MKEWNTQLVQDNSNAGGAWREQYILFMLELYVATGTRKRRATRTAVYRQCHLIQYEVCIRVSKSI